MKFAPNLPRLRPCKAFAALSLGWASPKPQPPSRSCATTGPAHFPDLNPQQAEEQSASVVHAPVMNWVPAPLAGAAVEAGGAAATGASAACPSVDCA